jgi:hypothetical protein
MKPDEWDPVLLTIKEYGNSARIAEAGTRTSKVPPEAAFDMLLIAHVIAANDVMTQGEILDRTDRLVALATEVYAEYEPVVHVSDDDEEALEVRLVRRGTETQRPPWFVMDGGKRLDA